MKALARFLCLFSPLATLAQAKALDTIVDGDFAASCRFGSPHSSVPLSAVFLALL